MGRARGSTAADGMRKGRGSFTSVTANPVIFATIPDDIRVERADRKSAPPATSRMHYPKPDGPAQPEHPDFARIELSSPAPFVWDDRLLRGRLPNVIPAPAPPSERPSSACAGGASCSSSPVWESSPAWWISLVLAGARRAAPQPEPLFPPLPERRPGSFFLLP